MMNLLKKMQKVINLVRLQETNDNEDTKQPAQEMILATTTSTQDSGLLDVLIPIFEEKHNVKVKINCCWNRTSVSYG
ncbi:hypothetical protein KHA80_09100 [Anaerobacillus sp. HL2]|nr:hypothetical protein KHA80_09100 [Anaerobacillus sp. HL2]